MQWLHDSTPCLHIIKRTVLKLAGLHHLRNFVPVFFFPCQVSLLFLLNFTTKKKTIPTQLLVLLWVVFLLFVVVVLWGGGGGGGG